jgi:formate dehydrogenase subunit gamma
LIARENRRHFLPRAFDEAWEAGVAIKSPWSEEQAREIIAARRGENGAMLPILRDLQDRFGYVDSAAVPMIADALNVSKAETIGVISFYHDYRSEPLEGAVLKLCRAESCQAMGCEDLVAHLASAHGLAVDAHGPGTLTIETVYCLGHCAASPAALLDGEPIARLDREGLDAIVARAGGAR